MHFEILHADAEKQTTERPAFDFHMQQHVPIPAPNGGTLHADERIHELMLMLGAHSDAGRRSVEEMLGEVAQVKQGALVLQ